MERIQPIVSERIEPTLLIDCTPTDLRAMADSLEASAKKGADGSSIVMQMSKGVSLHYRVRSEFKPTYRLARDSEEQAEVQ